MKHWEEATTSTTRTTTTLTKIWIYPRTLLTSRSNTTCYALLPPKICTIFHPFAITISSFLLTILWNFSLPLTTLHLLISFHFAAAFNFLASLYFSTICLDSFLFINFFACLSSVQGYLSRFSPGKTKS